jgi:spore maturation protein CgeB
LHYRLDVGPIIRSLNNSILVQASKISPDIVWIDKGIWISLKTVRQLRRAGAIVVHYTPDSAIAINSTPRFLKALPEYDFVITSKAWEISLYLKNGAQRVFHIHQGSSTARTYPVPPGSAQDDPFMSDICFVGRAEEHYVKFIKLIVARLPRLRLKIWGPWKKAVAANSELGRYWQGRSVYGDEYARALSSAKIGLGLLSKLFPETETTRTFEIPACKTMLLAERTQSHQQLFKEGEEAEFFDSLDEVVEKIEHYLSNSTELKCMAEAGYRRFIGSDYTANRYMADCVREITSVFKNRL